MSAYANPKMYAGTSVVQSHLFSLDRAMNQPRVPVRNGEVECPNCREIGPLDDFVSEAGCCGYCAGI